MCSKERFRKLTNKGMSLVEIIVAVAIIAIVTVPLLQSFVSSTRYNTKARETQRAIIVAQSLMEAFKAYSMEELQHQFSDPTVEFTVYRGIDGATYSCSTNPDNSYQFVLRNLNYDNKKYDVKITATQQINSNMSSMTNMNAYLDAIYAEPMTQNTEAYNLVMSHIVDELNLDSSYVPCSVTDLSTDKVYLKKVTTLKIDKQGAGVDVVTVDCVYSYAVYERPAEGGGVVAINKTGTYVLDLVPDDDTTTSLVIYNNENTKLDGAALRDIYFFYYPSYGHSGTAIPVDAEEIVFVNNTDQTKDVYLVKQFTTYGMSLGDVRNGEADYKPTVKGSNKIMLYHNLNKDVTGGGVEVKAPVFDHAIPAENISDKLIKENTETILYDVTISMYTDGAADEGFADTNKLVFELKGSKND